MKGQDHRLLRVRKRPPQAAQHGVRVPGSLNIDFQRTPHILRDRDVQGDRGIGVVLSVFVPGIAHMVLDAGGTVEQRASLRHGVGQFRFHKPRQIGV